MGHKQNTTFKTRLYTNNIIYILLKVTKNHLMLYNLNVYMYLCTIVKKRVTISLDVPMKYLHTIKSVIGISSSIFTRRQLFQFEN